MANVQWTPAQEAAIGYCGQNLLLSAAAGSGKTATLTERIASLVTNPILDVKISRILCVTFTRAAAAELRERLGRALRDMLAIDRTNAHLTRQLCDLGRASITTIHSYCLSVLRPHAAELRLPAAFSVATEAEAKSLARQTMTDVLTEFFDAGAEDFLTLADTLGGARSESSLDDTLLSLAGALTARGEDASFLLRTADASENAPSFFASPAGAGTRTRLARFACHYERFFSYMADSFTDGGAFERAYLPAALACLETARALGAAASDASYSDARKAFLTFAPPARLGTVRAAEQTEDGLLFKDVYTSFKKKIAALRAKSFSLTEEDTAVTASRTAAVCRAAARVLDTYFAELSARKRERGLVDFGDLETMTARLFTDSDGAPTDAAREAGRAFDYIFIDEYQDTNRMQDAIFSALAAGGARRFMVGDIKQSIYRFRGAEPDVFSSYRRAWPPAGETENAPGESLFLRENFRCDRTVVDFVNLVSRYLFAEGSIPFTPDDELGFAKSEPDGYTPAPVEICLLAERVDDGLLPPDEADYVADRIAALLAHERRADNVPFAPSDIAILLRSPGTDAGAFSDALAARGIPVENRAAACLYEEPEIALMLSLLRAVDNPTRDIDLAGAMKSPIFGFTLDDLIRIRHVSHTGSLWDSVRICAGLLPADAAPPDGTLRERCAAFCARLSELRADARGMKADRLLLRLYTDTDAFRLAECAGRDPESAAANLRALYEAARRFEHGGTGGGLYAFLRSIEEATDAAADEGTQSGRSAVRILSIHQSKGLEFPVCFLARADKRRNLRDANAPVLLDPAAGAVMRLPDEGGLVRCDTPQRASVSAAVADACAEEEMRVLYVAMTRARERLIVTASLPDPDAALRRAEQESPFTDAYSLYDAPSYIDWILAARARAALHGEGLDSAFVRIVSAVPQTGSAPVLLPEETAAPAAEAAPDDGACEQWMRLFRERFSFSYPYAFLAAVPAKLTVSKLHPGILDGEEESTELSRTSAVVPPSDRNRPPRFLSGKTEFEASFAGTATHMFLQFCDFDRLGADAAAELARLTSLGYLSREQADAVRLDEIARFAGSALFARMRSAVRVRREFRFNAALPAWQFTKDKELAGRLREAGTDVIVQGVVDCIFRDADGRVVLVDYKTDRLSERELADPALAARKLIARHADQLRYYRAVCAGMLGAEVDECLLYSLPLGDTIPVPAQP